MRSFERRERSTPGVMYNVQDLASATRRSQLNAIAYYVLLAAVDLGTLKPFDAVFSTVNYVALAAILSLNVDAAKQRVSDWVANFNIKRGWSHLTKLYTEISKQHSPGQVASNITLLFTQAIDLQPYLKAMIPSYPRYVY